MLSADEDLRDAHVTTLPQSLLQLSVVGAIDVDVLGLHADAEIVEEIQDVATLLERRADAAEAGDVHHHFPPLRVQLEKRERRRRIC